MFMQINNDSMQFNLQIIVVVVNEYHALVYTLRFSKYVHQF